MTLIECFDREPVDNVIACLRLRPEKVVFLGDEKDMELPLKRYQKFFANHGMKIRLVSCAVRMDDIRDIADALEEIIQNENQCVIDVTGGAEQVVMAVGMVLAELDDSARHRVDVQKFAPMDGQVMDTDGNGWVIPGDPDYLTVNEVIALHGGIVHPRTEQPPKRYKPADLQPLWETMCAEGRDWNKMVMALNEFESRCDSDTDIYLPLRDVASTVARFEEKEVLVRQLLEKLERCGVIRDNSGMNTLRYTYPDPLLRSCAQKAGNVLETKTLLEARSVQKGGKPYFQDCIMSVNIDWDGVVHDPADHIPETRNEIDGIMIRGVVPLFVSCKNGDVSEDELYKLSTVAQRFGGAYARKMLIVTDLDRKGPAATRAFVQRAREMGIYVVKDAASLSAAGWRRAFLDAMEA